MSRRHVRVMLFQAGFHEIWYFPTVVVRPFLNICLRFIPAGEVWPEAVFGPAFPFIPRLALPEFADRHRSESPVRFQLAKQRQRRYSLMVTN